MMKAILIEPYLQKIENIEINSRDEIAQHIGFDTIIDDEIDYGKNRVFFDEDCFLRGAKGKFQIDNLIPISGIAVIVGAENLKGALTSVTTSIDEIRVRTKFL